MSVKIHRRKDTQEGVSSGEIKVMRTIKLERRAGRDLILMGKSLKKKNLMKKRSIREDIRSTAWASLSGVP